MACRHHTTFDPLLDLTGTIGPDGRRFGGTNVAATAYSSLRDFIDRLEREGRLVRVAAPAFALVEPQYKHAYNRAG